MRQPPPPPLTGDVIDLHGVFSNGVPFVIPTNGVLNFNGSIVTNYVDESSAEGIIMSPGSILTGPGTIWNAISNNNAGAYTAIGFNQYYPAPTNFLIQDILFYCAADGLILQHTNYFSGRVRNCEFFNNPNSGGWDEIMCDTSPTTTNGGNVVFDNCHFHSGPTLIGLGGAALRCISGGGTNLFRTFNNCTWDIDNTSVAGYFMQDNTQGGSNTFNNCVFNEAGILNTTYLMGATITSGDSIALNSCTFNTATNSPAVRCVSGNVVTLNNTWITPGPKQVVTTQPMYVTGGNVSTASVLANLIHQSVLFPIYATNAPTAGVTNILTTDGTNLYWKNDNGLF